MLDSMRVRLTLWYTGVLAIVLIVFASVTFLYIARATRQRADDSLVETATSIGAALSPELNEGDKPPDAAVREMMPSFQFADRQILVFDGARLIASSDPPTAGRPRHPWPTTIENTPGFDRFLERAWLNGHECARWRPAMGIETCAVPLRNASGRLSVVAARSMHDEQESLEQVRNAFLIAVPLSLLLVGFSGYLLARRSLAPVAAMGEQAARISSATLHERLPVNNERDELGRLAVIFNELLGRLNLSFEQQRRFMADASHELRTPLAIVRGEAEVALSQLDRPNGEYRDALATIHDEGKRMSRVVEDLFTLARADAGQYPLQPTNFYLNDAVSECVHAARTLAAQRGLQVFHQEPKQEFLFRGDEALISRMIMNLLDNAIKHTPPGGSVRVALMQDGGSYVIEVEDTGVGISEEARPFIFERFYRADKSRFRNFETDGGGTGLGLSIARWIAEMHGGAISLRRSDSSGSLFVIRLPA
jgi:heavy metal sensor kinase